MKITPLEIRQKAFETNFRGYDKEEVDAFLLSLSQEWERVNASIREQNAKLESVERDLSKLREVESSLYITLKTAEETSHNLVDQANKTAQLQMREAQMNADAIINDTRSLAKDMIDAAEAAIKDSYELMKEQSKVLEQDYKALENHRENFMSELKGLAVSVIERVERSEKQKNEFTLKLDYSRKINLKEVLNPINEAFNAVVNTRPVLDRVVQNKPETSKLEIKKEEISTNFVKEEPKLGETKSTPESSEKSFFDLD